MKKKKKLNDKEREALKKKYRHIGKAILDILMYGFAIVMAIALAVGGACAPKKASAVYYGERYSNVSQLNVNDLDKYALYMPITDNYSSQIPDYSAISSYTRLTGNPLGGYNYATLNESVYIGDKRFTDVFVRFDSNNHVYNIGLNDINETTYYCIDVRVDAININNNNISYWNAIFNGTHYLFKHNDNFNVASKFFLFFMSTNSYRFVQSQFDFNSIKNIYSYMIDNQNALNDNTILNGWAFYSDYLYSELVESQSEPRSMIVPLLAGSFTSNGNYFNSIDIVIEPIYKNNSNTWYKLGGSNSGVTASQSKYNHYFYISTISYSYFGRSGSLTVCNINQTNPGGGLDIAIDIDDFNWLGGVSLGSSSPYTIINIIYIIMTNSDSDIFPVLNNLNSIEFLNVINTNIDLAYNIDIPEVTTPDYPILSVFEWLRKALTGIVPIFSLVFLPGITLGTVLLLPFSIMIILFVVHLFKR